MSLRRVWVLVTQVGAAVLDEDELAELQQPETQLASTEQIREFAGGGVRYAP